MSERAINTEDWRKRAPTQRERILADLRVAMLNDVRGWVGTEPQVGWVCAIHWNAAGIFRYGARIWELRHDDGHEIEERICAEHKVAEYRLAYDADWDKEP